VPLAFAHLPINITSWNIKDFAHLPLNTTLWNIKNKVYSDLEPVDFAENAVAAAKTFAL